MRWTSAIARSETIPDRTASVIVVGLNVNRKEALGAYSLHYHGGKARHEGKQHRKKKGRSDASQSSYPIECQSSKMKRTKRKMGMMVMGFINYTSFCPLRLLTLPEVCLLLFVYCRVRREEVYWESLELALAKPRNELVGKTASQAGRG